ncbi:XRE family transcriptional regulator [Asticcacaulis biprosthecium C19]|uniref:XRE family transcriptional regulator n=1 Tax=Asticcacaulis biprosthecium C19 TaxID=715226 RepID=F4QH59_9CAUL|nr:helix-turn-helix transcriptional regulator [Asticcacaulis biprosthecium]EGF92596.1 XRE family transcriptional regulator [Asticcacaulis biprosthecium C19]
MPVRVTLDIMLARRKVRAKDLAAQVGISETQMSLLRTGKVKGMRFDTLSKLCLLLACQPGDIMEYDPAQGDLTKGED